MQRPLQMTLFVALAVGAGLALFFAGRSPQRVASGVAPGVRPAASEDGGLGAPTDGGELDVIAGESGALDPTIRRQLRGDIRARRAASFAPAVRTVTLSGSVEVFDAGGDPVEASGSFYLAFSGGERLETRPVNFEGGVWSASVEASDAWAELAIRAPRIGRRSAQVAEPSAGVAFPFDGPLAVVLRIPRSAILRVVDAVSGSELREVCVEPLANAVGSLGAECSLPPLASPVSLDEHPGLEAATHVRVGAPGYAERSVRIDREYGGERWVALELGSELSVEVVTDRIATDLWLRLREVGSPRPVRAERVLRSGTFEFSRLQPGAYRIALESGSPPWGQPHAALPAWAERELELLPGRRIRVNLVCGPPPDLRPSAAAGIVRVPTSFEGDSLLLTFRSLGTDGSIAATRRRVLAERAPAADGGGLAFAWSLPDFEVGTHLFSVPAFSHHDVLQQPPGGRHDFVVDLTRLLELRLVDPALDPNLPRPALRWYPGPVGGPESSAERYAAWRSEEECWVLRAPPGPVHVWPSLAANFMRGERTEWETIELRSDGQVHTLRKRGSAVLTLRLRDGGVPVEVPPGPAVRLRSIGSAGDVHMLGDQLFERRFRAIDAGAYTLEVDAPLGYRPLAPLTLHLGPGENRTVEIELDRAHR